MGELTVRQFEGLAAERILLKAYYYRKAGLKQYLKRAACCVNELLIDYKLSGQLHTIARGEHLFLVCNGNQRIVCELCQDGNFGLLCITRRGFVRENTLLEAAMETSKLKAYRKEK